MTGVFDIRGRTALVTGSSRGIGLALAGGLVEAGCSVALHARDPQALERAAASLGGQVHHVAFDVTDRDAVDAGVAAVEAAIGPLDILVNNAGMQHRASLLDFPDDAWHRVIETNLTSAFYVGRAVARGMVERGRGKIVNIGSLQSELARAGTGPYAASKGGIKMLTRAMCAEWAPAGVQVNAIGPGYFDTELTSALVAGRAVQRVAGAADAGGALGEAGGADRHRALPRLARLRLRQRPDPVRRRRDVGGALERFEGRPHDRLVGVDAGPVPIPIAPWPTSIPRPSSTCSRAPRRRGSGSCAAGWGSRRPRPCPAAGSRASRSTRASTSGNRPSGVALTTMSMPSGTVNGPLQSTKSASAGVRSATSAASSSPPPRSRLTIVTERAPASAVSTAIARAAPPAPSTTSERPAGSATVRSEARKPWPSVFSPT